jgi:hypothetical protein
MYILTVKFKADSKTIEILRDEMLKVLHTVEKETNASIFSSYGITDEKVSEGIAK